MIIHDCLVQQCPVLHLLAVFPFQSLFYCCTRKMLHWGTSVSSTAAHACCISCCPRLLRSPEVHLLAVAVCWTNAASSFFTNIASACCTNALSAWYTMSALPVAPILFMPAVHKLNIAGPILSRPVASLDCCFNATPFCCSNAAPVCCSAPMLHLSATACQCFPFLFNLPSARMWNCLLTQCCSTCYTTTSPVC